MLHLLASSRVKILFLLIFHINVYMVCMCKLCLQVYKHMCVSTHVCSCMWRAGANVNHPLLLLHLVHRGKASQSNLEHASVSSPSSQLALGIHYSCLWRLELQVGLCTYLTVYMASGDRKCSLTLMQQACEPLSHLPRLYSSSETVFPTQKLLSLSEPSFFRL